ncbi:hypothetical protein LCGC14_2194590 [marine sediment metagenome]|uniref:Uncharacterized protein n=1 Tax=marine sediment metagenome TaxID=412755 RepID=A0A0F9E5L2_9ZZZZ
MIKRLEQLLEEIKNEPLRHTGMTEKEIEFLDRVGILNKNPDDYNLYLYYIGRLNKVINSKYSKE